MDIDFYGLVDQEVLRSIGEPGHLVIGWMGMEGRFDLPPPHCTTSFVDQ